MCSRGHSRVAVLTVLFARVAGLGDQVHLEVGEERHFRVAGVSGVVRAHSSLKLFRGNVLAARSLERLRKAVEDEQVAVDMFTAVGLVLKDHGRKFHIDKDKLADILAERGTFSHSSDIKLTSLPTPLAGLALP
jgi:hypothetical protein